MANVRAAGIVDTQQGWASALHRTDYMDDLVCENTTDAIFRGHTIDNYIFVFMYARIRMHVRGLVDLGAAVAYFIMELLAPNVPTAKILNQNRADRRVIADVANYFPLARNGTPINNASLTAAHAHFTQNNVLPVTPNDLTAPAAPAQLTYPQAVLIISILAHIRYHNSRAAVAAALFMTFICAVAKMGTVSTRYITKILNSVNDECLIDMDDNIFHEEVIREVWRYVGHLIDDVVMQASVARWDVNNFFPAHAIRARLIVAQIAGEGMTALSVVKKAIIAHPNFAWANLNALLPQEATNVNLALIAVGNNAYYGFRKNLDAVRSTLYKSYAWACKELMIRVSGEASLKNYRGWTRKPAFQNEIETLINNYEAVRGNIQPALYAAGTPPDVLRGAIAASATGATGLA